MNAPAECKDCAGLMRCTSSGEETDRCVHDQNARTRAALLATREEFTAEQVARQALMVRRAA